MTNATLSRNQITPGTHVKGWMPNGASQPPRNMILVSAMTAILFLGGWLPPIASEPFTWIPGPIWFALKIALVLFVFIWVRATFPRYRYDQLMRLGWKVFLPFSLVWLVLTAAVLKLTGWLPA